jgi:hypothetical protein
MKGTEAAYTSQRYSYPCPYATSIAALIVGNNHTNLPQTTPLHLIEGAYKVSISPQTPMGTLYDTNGNIRIIYNE